MRILILCTGNSCRSQMAHGILQSLDENIFVYSAGTNPTTMVHPKAIQVMSELGLNISKHTPTHINSYVKETWDYVITVCGGAKETCPTFLGTVEHRIHIGFEDPAEAKGTDKEILSEFRKIRDQILREFFILYHQSIKKYL